MLAPAALDHVAPGAAIRARRKAQIKQCEQARLCTELEKAIKSRTRFTVQAMPHGCEIIDCETGDLVRTIRLEEPKARRRWWSRRAAERSHKGARSEAGGSDT